MRWSLILLAAGCFSPNVPSGGYLCSANDQACPSGQHCTCGLCVTSDDQAACALDVSVDTGGAEELSVREHESFSVTLQARTASGGAAGGFRGTVALSFRLPDGTVWGDVRPPEAKLSDGRAQLTVAVNRETIPPQKPRLEARFAGATGQSAPLHVTPKPLTRDPAPIAQAPWSWASFGLGFPSVIHDGEQFRMYFVGLGAGMQRGVGVATSSDGKSFTPGGTPLFPDDSFMPFVLSAAPYQTPEGWRLAAYGTKDAANDIWLAGSSDGLSTFSLLNGGAPVVGRTSCAYCDFLVAFPSVVAVGDEWLMFFSAGHCNQAMCGNFTDGVSMAIGRARSTDGNSFQPEPAPVLSGNMGGETYLTAPQVLKDGSIYKMWYAFTRGAFLGDPCLGQIDVGYATSTDGFFWVRSPSNPVLSLAPGGWEGSSGAMVPGSVVPADGKDLASGVVMYYSPLQTVAIPPFCIPSGIGRAASN
jgi:hypothetical protein